MEYIKRYFRRSLLMMIFFMLVLLGLAVGVHYPNLEQFSNIYTSTYIVVFVLLFTLLQWMFLRNSLIKALTKAQLAPVKPSPKKKVQAPPKDREKEANDRRREFLHLFSVLQREGRLMDFFSEELEQYEDDQIGAAVRNIHDNCKKTIQKYIQPKAVITEEEGSTIEIPAGFDANAIKLTGNVVGDPPFKGTVRHRGWQAKKFELPVLSESSNPLIIAPAEVEID